MYVLIDDSGASTTNSHRIDSQVSFNTKKMITGGSPSRPDDQYKLIEDSGDTHLYADENGFAWALHNDRFFPLVTHMAGAGYRDARIHDNLNGSSEHRHARIEMLGVEFYEGMFTGAYRLKGDIAGGGGGDLVTQEFSSAGIHSQRHFTQKQGVLTTTVGGSLSAGIGINGDLGFDFSGYWEESIEHSDYDEVTETPYSWARFDPSKIRHIDFGSDEHYRLEETIMNQNLDGDDIIGSPGTSNLNDTITGSPEASNSISFDEIMNFAESMAGHGVSTETIEKILLNNIASGISNVPTINASLGSAVTPEPMIQSDPLVAAGPLDAVKVDEPRNNDF